MGKSPGKWIKTVLFGKKHSKSNLSKNATPDQRTPAEDASPVISDPREFAENGAGNIELEKGISGNSSTVNQNLEPKSNFVSVPLTDDEMRRQNRAATKAQAVFRGYLARRAFRALKGIIRLQALIRGHLVRRQAVVTFRCMQAVVKLQALARGRQVDIGSNSIFGSSKLATNVFARKLILSLPTAMPLSLQYDLAEPNSASNWLERWSLSRFWDPPERPIKVSNSKSQSKRSGPQSVENEPVKSKRSTRKASGDNGALFSLEMDNKPKRNPKKILNNLSELAQEQAQSELERVKHSLRKVTLASEKLETENEKPTEGAIIISYEDRGESDFIADKVNFVEAPLPSMTIDVPNNACLLVETIFPENGRKIGSTQFSHDEFGKSENQKISKRRSLPAKQEYAENISLNTPSLPSYMMATKSAKAKLRAQGSAKFSEDGAEVGYVRRHSLPASMNGKISSLSPRVQQRVHGNGKGGNGKSNHRLMTSSKDDKALQPGWRR